MEEVIDLNALPNAWGASLSDTRRFFDKIEEDQNGCWVWTGATNSGSRGGYSYFSFPAVGKPMVLGHRFAYALLVGDIPEGDQIDHLCRNRLCVNPAHMESVLAEVNLARGETIPARYAERTHCANGHEFTEENTRRGHRSPNSRECRTCDRDRVRKIRKRARASL